MHNKVLNFVPTAKSTASTGQPTRSFVPFSKSLELNMDKACPVLIKTVSSEIQILCFEHPLAGTQIVKGTIVPGEVLEEACSRELKEESGVSAKSIKILGRWESGFQEQVWGFCLMETKDNLPDSWEFYTKDGGGLLFKFFWHPLSKELSNPGHIVFEQARGYVHNALTGCSGLE